MAKALFYWLFGFGKIPAAFLSPLQAKGVILLDESVKSSVTYLDFHRPGRITDYRRRKSVREKIRIAAKGFALGSTVSRRDWKKKSIAKELNQMFIKSSLKLFLVAFFIALAAGGANAANAIVTIPNDVDGVGNCETGGSCSLRQAVNSVGNNDLIFFDLPAANCPNGVCTVELTLGTLTIFRSMTFIGTGARSLIVKRSAAAGTPNFTVFTIAVNGIGTIGIYGMTISNGIGSTASGIAAGGRISLTISGVNITNNTLSSGYGGIYSNTVSTLIENSLIANNSGSGGGGIHNAGGEMTIVDSTVSGNTALFQNGVAGILNDGSINNPATLNLINVTVANNKTMLFNPALAIGGVYNAGTANVRNTIIAGNKGEVNSPNDVGGSFISRGNNLIGDTVGSGGFGGSGSNDIINQPARLAPLANNGGPTDTHALLADSPAINAGNDCVLNMSCANVNPPMNLAFDQRTQPFARKYGAAIDIGAYELQFSPTAAGVTIGGRVFASERRGLANARVMLTTANGETQTVLTNSFGYYHFDDVPARQTVVLNIISKRFQFAPQVVNVTEELPELNFLPQQSEKNASRRVDEPTMFSDSFGSKNN